MVRPQMEEHRGGSKMSRPRLQVDKNQIGNFATVIRRITMWSDVNELVDGSYIYPQDLLFILGKETKFNFWNVFCPRLEASGWVFGECLRLLHETNRDRGTR
jgi:hypothetical protein